MSTALLLVDSNPEEHDSCLQIASFAAAALVADDALGKRERVALLASPADALEILLAVWGVRGRTGPDHKRSPLVLLPPLPARNGDMAQQTLMLGGDEPGSGTLADLERAGVFTFSEMPDAHPETTLRRELSLPGTHKVLVFGGRPELWTPLVGQTDIISFGQDARQHRGSVKALRLIEELAEASLTKESLVESSDSEIQYGVWLGRQIAATLEYLAGP
jgi:hypothetical protein